MTRMLGAPRRRRRTSTFLATVAVTALGSLSLGAAAAVHDGVPAAVDAAAPVVRAVGAGTGELLPSAPAGVARAGKGRDGKGRDGKGRDGKDRDGKDRDGKDRDGKGRGVGVPLPVPVPALPGLPPGPAPAPAPAPAAPVAPPASGPVGGAPGPAAGSPPRPAPGLPAPGTPAQGSPAPGSSGGRAPGPGAPGASAGWISPGSGAAAVAWQGLRTPAPAVRPETLTVPAGLRKGRLLVVRSDRIEVANAGKVLRIVPLDGTLDLSRLPELVDAPAWARRIGPRTVRLGAVLAQRPGAVVVGSRPWLRRLELGDAGGLPARMLGTQARLTLSGLTVTVAPGAGAPGTAIRARPATRPVRPDASGTPAPAGPTVVGTDTGPGTTGTGAGSTGTGTAAPGTGATGGPGPSLYYQHGSEVLLTRTRLVGLGSTGARGAAALRVSRGGTAVLRVVDVVGGGRGIVLQNLAEGTLDRVSTTGTAGPGVAVAAGIRVGIGAVTALHARGDGIEISGPTRGMTVRGPLRARGNAGDGVSIVSARTITLDRVSTSANTGAGVRVRQSDAVTLTRLGSRGDGQALYVSDTDRLRVTGLTSNGGTSGVAVRGVGKDAVLAGVIVNGPAGDGIAVSARGVTVSRARVTGADEALVVESGSRDVAVRDSALGGGRTGVRVAAGAQRVVIERVQATAADGTALRANASGVRVGESTLTGAVGAALRERAGNLALDRTKVTAESTALDVAAGSGAVTVTGGSLDGNGSRAVNAGGSLLRLSGTSVGGGAEVGVDARGTLTADHLSVAARSVAVRVSGQAQATVEESRLEAGETGVATRDGASARVVESQVLAPRASDGDVVFEGDNRFSHLPVRRLGIVALLAIGLAVLLEVVRKVRDRHEREHGEAPVHVLNRT